jgi:hypothetical protein
MRILCFFLALLAGTQAPANDQPFDIDLWHEGHPVTRQEAPGEPGFNLGLYPRGSAVMGIPNGVAASVQLSVSMRKPGSYSLYLGGGYEVGPAVEGGNLTVGWGGVREAPATVPQLGFSGAFLRYRHWHSDDHGRHRGLSFGLESGLGSFGLALEAGLARSDRNHWIPVARLSISVGRAWMWKL